MTSATLPTSKTSLPPQVTKADVAALSHAEIAVLTADDMLRVIAVAELPFAQNRSLTFQSAETLRQVTHLACQCCRNQGF